MEPTPEQAAEGTILVKVLAAVLERLVNSNTTLARSDPGQITKFHALKPPGIGIEAYLERIYKYASCSNECFVLALIYIDRLIQRNNFLLTELNVHRVVITAILLAAKFFDDAYYNNAYYSKVGGVLVSELNGLEVDFLFRINFSLHVQPEIFDKYKAELVAHSNNSGLALALTSSMVTNSPLPQIAEMEPSSRMSSPELIEQQEFNYQQQRLQQQFPMHTACAPMPGMAPPPQVTPSPSNVQDMHHVAMMNGHTVIGNPLQPPPPPPVNPMNFTASDIQNVYLQSQVQEQQQQHLEFLMNQQQQQLQQQKEHRHQQSLLQRANSLPPLFSSSRCVDHAIRKQPPYHSAPTPMAPMLPPMMNMDHEQYELMMNQLFPIQTTLMHHNHASSNNEHHDHLHHNHQSYTSIQQGTGIGSLVAHY